jgi:hypothetical protein
MSILDCLFDLVGPAPIFFVGVAFAGEEFVGAGEKLILVWRFCALVRLRPMVFRYMRGEGQGEGELAVSYEAHAPLRCFCINDA